VSTRYHVLRSEYSPTMGLRQVILTRQACRRSKAIDVLLDAALDTNRHMRRGGLVEVQWLGVHFCEWTDPWPVIRCPDPTGHIYALWWHDDPTARLTTLRLVERTR